MPVALVGDVMRSRGALDQRAMLESVAAILGWVNQHLGAEQPLSPTVGDEFQGVFRDLEAALDASLLLRLRALRPESGPSVEFRMGLGAGEIVQSEVAEAPYGQSGSAWWAARAAIDHLEQVAGRSRWPRSLRTAFRGSTADQERLVNAFLLCRDQVVGSMDERDARICLGLFLGRTQSEMAAELGVTQPAVAQRAAERGLYAVWRAHLELDRP
jgi:hypothetical protein